MRYLGIDYGTKRVGLALSDESGSLAFAHGVIETGGAAQKIGNLTQIEGVGQVVLGKSLNLDGSPNPLMEKIERFKQELERLGLHVSYESEVMTSAQAARAPGGERGQAASPGKQAGKPSGIDAAAAALILQGYLDKIKNTR